MTIYIRIYAVLAFGIALASRLAGAVAFGTDPANHDATPLPPRPGYLQSYLDPDFHTRVTRISDSTTAVDGTLNFSHGVRWGNTVRNHYRTIEPWNADMTLLLIQNESFAAGVPGSVNARQRGQGQQLILDGATYAFKEVLPVAGFDCRWHPTDPNILFYLHRNELSSYDFSRHVSTLIHRFDRYPAVNGAISINNSNVSNDGRWLVLHASDGPDCDFFVYDLTVAPPADGTARLVRFSRTKVDARTGKSYYDPIHPWATMTPSGNAVVMFWNDAFSEVYDRSFHYLRTLEPSGSSHYDLANENGRDYVIGVHKNPGSGGRIYRSGLDGAFDPLTTAGFGGGTSTRNIRDSRWAIVSYDEARSRESLSNEVDAVDLDSSTSATTRRIAHLFNGKVDYPSESHPVASPDGQRVLFQSNWGDRGGNGRGTDTYVADLRPPGPLGRLMAQVAERVMRNAPLRAGDLHYGDLDAVKSSVTPKTAYWDYTTGVSLRGLEQVYALTGDPRLLRYVTENNVLSAHQYAFLRWQKAKFGSISSTGGFGKLWRLSMLDDCGSMGVEILDSRLRDGAAFDAAETELVDTIGRFVTQQQSRLPDGTFWRPESPDGPTIWADDLYMGVPFLIRWSEYRDDPAWLNDAARQVINFASYLQDRDGVFFHAYFVKEKRPNGFKWGRANGWAAVATADVLSVLPSDNPAYPKVLAIFRRQMEGLAHYQAPDGLWNQVIDHPELRWGTESSCSAEFISAMARGVRAGWLPGSYREIIHRALEGLIPRLTPEGGVRTVCKSTSIGRDLAYYDTRPKVDDDPHGLGTVLLALTEAAPLFP